MPRQIIGFSWDQDNENLLFVGNEDGDFFAITDIEDPDEKFMCEAFQDGIKTCIRELQNGLEMLAMVKDAKNKSRELQQS